VSKYGSATLKWHIAGRRHVIRSILLIVGGPFAATILAGSLLSIDNTANTIHLSTFQDALSTVALTLGFSIAIVAILMGVARLRRVAVGGTTDLLVITAKRRFAIPLNVISKVAVSTPTEDPKMHLPGVVLVSGMFVGVPDCQCANETGVIGLVDVDDMARRPTGSDRAWSAALTMREHLPGLVAMAPPSSGLTFNSVFPVQVASDKAPPTGAVVTITDKEVGVQRRYMRRMSWILILPFFYALQLQDGSNHAFNVAQYLLGVLGITAFVVLLLGLTLLLTIAEVRMGTDWLAVRRNSSRKWSVVRRDDVVSITTLSTTRRSRRTAGPTIVIADGTGRKISIPDAWLTPRAAQQLLAVCGTLPLWQSGVKETLTQKSSSS
jgi:hypothetical protein